MYLSALHCSVYLYMYKSFRYMYAFYPTEYIHAYNSNH